MTADSVAVELIPLRELDEPELAIRETMDEIALGELAESIQSIGLITPLVVERHGARFRVVAGHRRLIACQIAKHDPVACIVREPGEIDKTAITLAENYYREAVNPVEEAEFLRKLLDERCHNDIELLAGLVKRKIPYIDDRLFLLRGDAGVLVALREQKISLAVARELNRVKKPETRIWLLDAALKGGATAALVRNWRQQYDADGSIAIAAGENETPTAATPAMEVDGRLRCMFCDDTENSHMMQALWIHQYCYKVLRQLAGLDQAAATKEG